MRAFHAVGFVVPNGLHPGPAEVIAAREELQVEVPAATKAELCSIFVK